MDKKGNPAKVFDVVVNPKVIERIRPNPTQPLDDNGTLATFAEVLFNYAAQKFKLVFAARFDCLKKCKYKGNYVKYQRVKGTKKPKINVIEAKSVLNSDQNRSSTCNTNFASQAKAVIKPDWKLFLCYEADEKEEFDGLNFSDDVTGCEIQIHLPLLATGTVISQIS